LVNLPIDQDGCDGAVIVNSWLTVDDAKRLLPVELRRRYWTLLESYVNYPTTFHAPLPEHVEDLCTIEARRFDLAYELLLGEEWDHFFVLFSSTDWLAHAAAGSFLAGDADAREAYLQLYRLLDDRIGRLVAAAPDALVVVLSDHGQCHERYALHVNAVLRELGLVTLRGEAAEGRAVRVPPLLRKLHVDGPLRPATAALRRSLKARLDVELVTPRRAVEVDRLRSRAFTPTVASYGIYGELDDAEIEQVTYELRRLRLPDGRFAVDGVWTHEELYGRPAPDGGPVLLFAPANGVRPSTSVDLPAVRPVSTEGRGAHQRDGIVIVHGPDVLAGDLGRVSLYDVAPTLAWAMGSSVLEGSDGRVLFEAFAPDAVVRPVEYASLDAVQPEVEGEGDEAAVAERLKALGYI
jgi:predicted AlkP superfamily phosphohydrolase/phosphomutase